MKFLELFYPAPHIPRIPCVQSLVVRSASVFLLCLHSWESQEVCHGLISPHVRTRCCVIGITVPKGNAAMIVLPFPRMN